MIQPNTNTEEYQYPPNQHLSSVYNRLIVGEKYDYKEGGMLGEVEFLGNGNDEEFFELKLKWIIAPIEHMDGMEFVVSWSRESEIYYYSGAWQLLPLWSYIFPRRQLPKS